MRFFVRLKIFINLLSLFLLLNLSKAIYKHDLKELRGRVKQMFEHSYNGYLRHAYPLDELRPLTCDGHDTWGSFSLTLVDALDTLAVMGNHTEFKRAVKLVLTNLDPNKNVNVSVFETNIRVVGGLLSAHLMSRRVGLQLEPGWPCTGPLLRLAESFARKLLFAFDTPTGMPYGTVNLRNGVPMGETSVTCTAGVATFIVEFGALSSLTGDPLFETVALNALRALWKKRSNLGLVGNHIDVLTGKWTAQDAGIGAGVDSYFEYLAKGSMLFRMPELHHMFNEYKSSIDAYLRHDDWHFWVNMDKGSVSLPVFQSLEAYWPGVLSLTGHFDNALKSLHNYHQVWKQFGFTPEFYSVPKYEPVNKRGSYPLRPELIESIVYLYRATKDPMLLQMGVDILESIERVAKTECGYATVTNVRTHALENRMESFFLSETTKYLYLLFDQDNFLHNDGSTWEVINTPGGQCVIEAGGWVFNTEAHPVDPGALHCCSAQRTKDLESLALLHDQFDLVRVLNLSVDDEGFRSATQKMTVEEEEDVDARPTETLTSMDDIAPPSKDKMEERTAGPEAPKPSSGSDETEVEVQVEGDNVSSMITEMIKDEKKNDLKSLFHSLTEKIQLYIQKVQERVVLEPGPQDHIDLVGNIPHNMNDTTLLTCPSDSFHRRFSVYGEMIQSSDKDLF